MAAAEGIHLENKFIYTWNVSTISPFNFLFTSFYKEVKRKGALIYFYAFSDYFH
jgi:hypothetical protein